MDSTRSGYDPEESVALYARIGDRVRVLPGVRSVTMAQTALLGGGVWKSTVYVEGQTGAGHGAHMMTVAPSFFDTMEIPLLTGRGFEHRDDRDAPRVAVINAAAAMELFGTDDAVGRRFGFQPEERGEIEVVGVVRDTRYDDLRDAAPPTVFRSAIQSPLRSATFAVRTAGPPNALTPAVRESIRQIDPRLPIMNVTTQTAAIEERLSDERLFAVAYASFGGLATLLAAIGLFGLASYTVTRRTGEIGIRMALGASSTGIAWMVLRQSLVLVAGGVAAGVGSVLLAGRLVASLIHGLAPTDPITILQAAAVLAGMAAAAAYLPARRVARRPPDRAPRRVSPWTGACARRKTVSGHTLEGYPVRVRGHVELTVMTRLVMMQSIVRLAARRRPAGGDRMVTGGLPPLRRRLPHRTTVDVSAPRGRGLHGRGVHPGPTPMEAVHFTELRMRIDELRSRYRLPTLRWTDPEPHPPTICFATTRTTTNSAAGTWTIATSTASPSGSSGV